MKLGNGAKREYTQLPREWQSRQDEDATLDDLPEGITPPARYEFAGLNTIDDQTDAPARPEDCSSVIGAGSAWQGNFSTEGSVRLEGRISGEVKAAGTVHITEGAEVSATVHGKFIVIAGSFDGQLFCSDRVVLQPSSRVRGAITTRLFSVGEGAFIDGEIHMVDELPAAVVARAGAASKNGGNSSTLFGEAAGVGSVLDEAIAGTEPPAEGRRGRTRG